MIALNDIVFEIGSRALYDEASWHIKPQEKYGLIGPNGAGKTTLLRIIVGEYRINSGIISKAKDLKIGYLNQDLLSYQSEHSILHVAMEAFEEQNKLHDEIEEILKKLETDYSDNLIEKLSKKQEAFEALDGYNLQYKAESILAGLGFSASDTSRPLQEFSGGWRMRVMLAKILLQQPDLLLLDEPTNHLDLPSIQWLEEYLRNFEGACIVVSHDRWFLDRTCDKTVESRNGKLTLYHGNYTFYEQEKALREEIQGNQFKNQQQYIKQEQMLIDRFRAKASKAKMAQSRLKALEKIDRVEAVESDDSAVNFRFKFSKNSGRHVCTLENLRKSYPGLEILKDTTTAIEKGDKIALIGANGKGKSTLLRMVAGVESHEGKSTLGHNVSKAFFAQHQLESLHLESDILSELVNFAPAYTETELRTLLGCFLFAGDDVYKKIKVLSGGEKSRVALAKTITCDANFLLMDEPTNHLDMRSVRILIQALQQFEGTFVAVSHDRFFLSQIANKIWWIEDKELKEYPGTYNEWEEWQAKIKIEKAKSPKASEPAPKPVEKKETKPVVDHSNEKELKKLRQDLKKLEEQVEGLEKEKADLEAQLADETVYGDAAKLKEATARYDSLKARLSTSQNDWEQLAERILELE